MNRRRWLRTSAGLAAAAATGMAKAQAPDGGTREVVDGAGRRVRAPARVRRVFAAGPPASVLVYAVAPDALTGWTTPFRPAERAFVPAQYADLPTTGRLTGRGGTASLESLVASRSDVVVDYGAVSDTYVSLAERVQAQTGVPVLLLDGTFDRIGDALGTIGMLVGAEARARALAGYARSIVDDVARRVASVPRDERPRLYYARGPRGLETGLAGSITTEIVDRMGAINVAASIGRGGLTQVSLEQLLAWDPQLIVTTDPNFFATVGRDPLWRRIAAVRTGRVHLAPAEPFGWIDFPPSLNRVVGLPWLGRILYPRQFTEDLRPVVREFYTRCYHRTPTDDQIEALIATSERTARA